MDDPTREAVKLLRADLESLQARNLAPTEQAAIGRMIERRLELRPVFETIWNPDHIRPHHERGGFVWLDRPVPCWPCGMDDCFHPEGFALQVNYERWRLLRIIIETAATVPQLAADRREASRELPDLLDEFGKMAKAMAAKLERIRHHAHAGGLMLPSRLSSPIDLMTKAAEDYGPDSFNLIARDDLVALASDHRRHLPDLQAMLDSLATVTRAEMEHAEPMLYRFARQKNAINDYTRTLLKALARYWNVAVYLQPFEFTAAELLTLATVMTDTPPDELPTDPERGIRAILREHRKS